MPTSNDVVRARPRQFPPRRLRNLADARQGGGWQTGGVRIDGRRPAGDEREPGRRDKRERAMDCGRCRGGLDGETWLQIGLVVLFVVLAALAWSPLVNVLGFG